MERAWILSARPFFAPMVFYAILCPFTKVEESFNLHACHDILFHGADLTAYDHHDFPGVVPRTFLGAMAVSAVSAPLVAIVHATLGKAATQAIVRLVLGAANALALGAVRRGVDMEFGAEAGRAFAVGSALQFHLPFYATRTLPNTFALVFTSWSLAELLRGRSERSLLVLVPATVIFRGELLAWLAPAGLVLLAAGRVSFWRCVRRGVAVGVVCLVLSVAVDSLFWGRVLWPEGAVLHFNVVLNRSSDWGRSPWHWYFTSALPRALLWALPAAAVGAWREPRARVYAVIPAAFAGLYSALPHKELRFILYAVPWFNVAAAVGVASLLQTGKRRTAAGALAVAAVAGASASACAAFAAASAANYPGASALRALHAADGRLGAQHRVHIDAAAAMSGVSLFLQDHDSFVYSKDEGRVNPRDFTHLVTERSSVAAFELVHEAHGFDGLRLWPPGLRTSPKVYVHRRRHDRAGSKSWAETEPGPLTG